MRIWSFDLWICSFKDTVIKLITVPTVRNELWEEEAEGPVGQSWASVVKRLRPECYFSSMCVRHSFWWAVSASGQINGSVQMFLLVKNKEEVRCLHSTLAALFYTHVHRKTPDKTTNVSLTQERNLFEAELSLKREAFSVIKRGWPVWCFWSCVCCVW